MLILYGFVIAAVVTDIKSGKISNRLILIGLGISLVRKLLQEGGVGLLTGVIQISLPVIVLYLFFLIGALGAGDIKLFSLIGGFVNFKELITCIVVAFVLGAIGSVIKMLISGGFIRGISVGSVYLWNFLCGNHVEYKKTAHNVIPFSIPILGGLVVATLLS